MIRRRVFLVTAATLAGGTAVGVGFLSRAGTGIPADFASGEQAGGVALNAWVRIEPDGTIAVAVPRAEMGQGINTAFAMLVAEELDVSLERIRTEHPDVHGVYANYAIMLEKPGLFHKEGHPMRWVLSKIAASIPLIVTGGSTSVIDAWKPLRQAGAAARHMLVTAAAERWGVAAANCRTHTGQVVHPDGGTRLDYADIANAAALIEPPSAPVLKSASDFRIIGTTQKRLDIPAKVTGAAIFGIDVTLQDMWHAAVVHCPIKGSRIATFNADKVMRMRGVKGVHRVSGGVAVVADNTWRAFAAAQALPITLDPSDNDTFASTDFDKSLQESLSQKPTNVFESRGDMTSTLGNAAIVVEAEYSVPYLAHACMEPMNATVRANEDGSVDVWAPTQSPTIASWGAAEGTGVDRDQVRVHVTYLGGGFGRKAEKDFIVQTAQIATHYPARPIKLTWSREQDIKNDTYRPMARARMRGALDAAGKLSAWDSHLASQSTEFEYGERTLPFGGGNGAGAFMNAAGAFAQPYDLKTCRVAHHWLKNVVPVGFWRSVGHSQNAFFFESFMDEMAYAAHTDAFEFRRELLHKSPRHKTVLEAVAQLAEWGKPAAPALARGIALHESFGSIVAQVAEVVIKDGKVRVTRVWAAADTGVVINPDTVKAQLESGIIFGLTAALYGEITLEAGQVQQSNFPDYEMVRLADAPHIETLLVPSGGHPGGVGEIGTPPIAPALANAVFAATGQRLRDLPLKLSDIFGNSSSAHV